MSCLGAGRQEPGEQESARLSVHVRLRLRLPRLGQLCPCLSPRRPRVCVCMCACVRVCVRARVWSVAAARRLGPCSSPGAPGSSPPPPRRAARGDAGEEGPPGKPLFRSPSSLQRRGGACAPWTWKTSNRKQCASRVPTSCVACRARCWRLQTLGGRAALSRAPGVGLSWEMVSGPSRTEEGSAGKGPGVGDARPQRPAEQQRRQSAPWVGAWAPPDAPCEDQAPTKGIQPAGQLGLPRAWPGTS